ncbi:hypothetical protein SNEBB_004335 [Seison nebaliae]|nr:hypothetical protein SNEBB_004335 [Seison nebaliae]
MILYCKNNIKNQKRKAIGEPMLSDEEIQDLGLNSNKKLQLYFDIIFEFKCFQLRKKEVFNDLTDCRASFPEQSQCIGNSSYYLFYSDDQ